jgi:aerobic-type carbon monoxide dehydrogenase small subunit (CoxS/CutS family)
MKIHNGTTMQMSQADQQRAQDVLIKESGADKLVIIDRDGDCLAFVLAWDSFGYDAQTDTLCIADTDGREVMTTICEENSNKTVRPINTQ